VRPRTTTAALVEKYDTVNVRIEELPVIGLTTRTRPPMQEHDRDAVMPAAFLDMQRMTARHRQ
jgi:hypothetical protein